MNETVTVDPQQAATNMPLLERPPNLEKTRNSQEIGYRLMKYLVNKKSTEMAEYRGGQYKVLLNIAARLMGGERIIDVVMPTGSGKTWVMKEVARILKDDVPLLVFTYSNGIGSQIKAAFNTINLAAREIVSKPGTAPKGRETNVIVQPYAHSRDGGHAPLKMTNGTVLFIDEVHTKIGNLTARHLVSVINDACFTLTFTATPDRNDKKTNMDASVRMTLSNVDDPIIISYPDALEMGQVSPFQEIEVFGDINGAKSSKDGLPHILLQAVTKVVSAMLPKELRPIPPSHTLAEGAQATIADTELHLPKAKKVIVVCENNRLAQVMAESFKLLNISAVYCNAEDKKSYTKNVQDFNNPDSGIQVITGSDILTIGTDMPIADVVVIIGSHNSKTQTAQIGGRVLRPVEGKIASIVRVFTNSSVHENTSVSYWESIGLQKQPVTSLGNFNINVSPHYSDSPRPAGQRDFIFKVRQVFDTNGIERPHETTSISEEADNYTNVDMALAQSTYIWRLFREVLGKEKNDLKSSKPLVISGDYSNPTVQISTEIWNKMNVLKQEWISNWAVPNMATKSEFAKSMGCSLQIFYSKQTLQNQMPRSLICLSGTNGVFTKYDIDELKKYTGTIETHPVISKFDEEGEQIWFGERDFWKGGPLEKTGIYPSMNPKTLAAWAEKKGLFTGANRIRIIRGRSTITLYHINLIKEYAEEHPKPKEDEKDNWYSQDAIGKGVAIANSIGGATEPIHVKIRPNIFCKLLKIYADEIAHFSEASNVSGDANTATPLVWIRKMQGKTGASTYYHKDFITWLTDKAYISEDPIGFDEFRKEVRDRAALRLPQDPAKVKSFVDRLYTKSTFSSILAKKYGHDGKGNWGIFNRGASYLREKIFTYVDQCNLRSLQDAATPLTSSPIPSSILNEQ